MTRILALDGSIHGASGNTARMMRRALGAAPDVHGEFVHLVDETDLDAVIARIGTCDALLVGTGTYWDACGHPLQRFIEEMTLLEASPLVTGKPAGFLVTCESVGGKCVLNRLQGVFSSMGFLLPPMSGLVLSRVADLARQAGCVAGPAGYGEFADLWDLEDLDVVVANLVTAARLRPMAWTTWGVQTNAHPTWPLAEDLATGWRMDGAGNRARGQG